MNMVNNQAQFETSTAVLPFNTVTPVTTDALLIELSAKLDAAQAELNKVGTGGAAGSDAERRYDAAFQVAEDIVDQMELLPVHTLDGLRAKARAFRWCRGDEGGDSPLDGFGDTSDVRLLHQILAWLAEPSPAMETFRAGSYASPILKLFHEWEIQREAGNNAGADEDCLKLACERMSALEQQIIDLPVTTAQEFAAKLISSTSFGDYELCSNPDGDRILAEAAELLGAKYEMEAARS